MKSCKQCLDILLNNALKEHYNSNELCADHRPANKIHRRCPVCKFDKTFSGRCCDTCKGALDAGSFKIRKSDKLKIGFSEREVGLLLNIISEFASIASKHAYRKELRFITVLENRIQKKRWDSL